MGDYVKRKKVIEKINGEYVHQSSKELDLLMLELNEAVENILSDKDLEQLRAKHKK